MNDPEWIFSDYDTDGFNTEYSQTYSLFISGNKDTIGYSYFELSSLDYTYLFDVPGSNYCGATSNPKILLRQVDRSIRFFEESTNTDSLFINYNLSIGDTARGHWTTLYDYNQSTFFILDSLDSVLIGSEYRRILYFQSTNSTNQAVVYEGLFQSYPDGNQEKFVFKTCILGYHTHHFACYGSGETPEFYWLHDSLSCQLLDLSQSSEQPYDFYPNPATDLIYINRNDIDDIKIFNSVGQLMIVTKEKSVDISDLKVGTYFIFIKYSNGNTFRHQFIRV